MDTEQQNNTQKKNGCRTCPMVREEFIFADAIIEQMTVEKNRCIKTILQTIELVHGKDNNKQIDVRRIILRSVNDYHRYILSIFEKVM